MKDPNLKRDVKITATNVMRTLRDAPIAELEPQLRRLATRIQDVLVAYYDAGYEDGRETRR